MAAMLGDVSTLFASATNFTTQLLGSGAQVPPMNDPAAAAMLSTFFGSIMKCIVNSQAYLWNVIYNYMIEHPFWFAYDVITSSLFFIPGACMGPVLRFFGFTRVGPAAGSWAARVMSKFGTVVAHGWYASCQSAQMGGYGGAIVKVVFRGTGAVLQGIGVTLRFWDRE